jgi:SAM-dependent methyltransferase
MSRENPVTSRLFDSRRKRLVYLGKSATPELWDKLWSLDKQAVDKALTPSRDGDEIVRITRRYVQPSDGAILEGGCGKGQFVAALQRAGYEAIGLDFAEATVSALNDYAPTLDIRVGDLRDIPLPDASVAGYWSIGVIEHFWDGYLPLAKEMARVVQDGGYLFCSFPYMSRLRKVKASLGLYPSAEFSAEPSDFYQFALEKRDVMEVMSEVGFSCVAAHPSSGIKGILGEFGVVSNALEMLYDYSGSSFLIRAVRKGCDVALTAAGSAHSILLIFKRNPRSVSVEALSA